jgi:hypothetical protein
VRAEPPSAPAENAIDNDVSPGVIEIPVGALGIANVVIEFETADTTDVPALFVAVTTNV